MALSLPAVRGGVAPWLALCVACVAALGAAWMTQRRRRQQPPRKWKSVGKLSAITIYPLKSGRGISLKEADCTERGIAEPASARDGVFRLRDRTLIVYDPNNGMFITGRKIPRILLIEVKAEGPNSVVFSTPEGDTLKVELPQDKSNLKEVTMWKQEKLWTVDCGDEAAAWFSNQLTKKPSGLRLGYDLDNKVGLRTVDVGPLEIYKKVYPMLTSKDMGMYTDFSSYMLMTESSLEDLREKVPAEVAPSLTIRQFRPTFVVSGTAPYEEDNWGWIRIGENVILKDVKPCTRCVMTTVHPDTVKKFDDLEPLRTLRKYRKVTKKSELAIEGEAPVLGRYLGLHQGGSVKIGDEIFVPA
ncbi:mitochondrial amidoxime reducing component 2 isoform X2 [Schistocerca gregaria]|nr:mitochondrial amidoxime reducing component 2 isoform X2 [Schistocerca gregaria]XP_049863114.1 mitochondrial amidoxime reducing component 2 isoform X2 [Schistocerca gregaria]XP_049863115.1 mitochondrial amidoxime reducing component 2 isoform X2 [Schistocerca gregaria]